MGKKGEPIDGVMIIDKPQGMGSNWALQITRRLINAQKAGHTGTLDPMATGILPLAFGNATKYSADLLNADKRYTATVRFGIQTDTMDATGETIATSDRIPSREDIEGILGKFTGEISQVPPMYSAIKHEGKNLYELARKGVEIEREPRKIRIYWLKLISYAGDTAVIDARVSKGTYIRVLADDLGKALGTYAHLTALRRTEVGDLTIEDAVAFSEIDDPAKSIEERRAYLKGADYLLKSLPEVTLDETDAKRLRNGQRLAIGSSVRGTARAYGPDRQLLGVVEVDFRGTVHPSRLIKFITD
jgi:tRNA pseudouridine55 synthase